MIIKVTTLRVLEPEISIPPFLHPDSYYSFSHVKNREGDVLFFNIMPLLQCDHIAERTRYTIAWSQFDLRIETDGQLATADLYPLFVTATNLFKNMLALSSEGPRIGPMYILCPPQEEMEKDLQVLVDWFYSQ